MAMNVKYQKKSFSMLELNFLLSIVLKKEI